jgi:hypothetical protein
MTLAGKNDDGRLRDDMEVDSTGVVDLAPPNEDIIEAPCGLQSSSARLVQAWTWSVQSGHRRSPCSPVRLLT